MSSLECNSQLEVLLDYLKQQPGCDLSGYKRNTLMRRFQCRMQQLEIEDYAEYLGYIQKHPQETVPLLDTILINFSDFFRDRDSWDYLANNIIPQIIKSKQPHEKIRVWSAGCAHGQEVYTLVMLLAENLGIEQFLQRVQIFATDVDEDAIAQARQASYRHHEVAGIPSNLLSKYFKQTQQHYVFHSKLRRTIVFGRHNVAVDAPMSKIDLLVCRNVLIYFNSPTQAKTQVRFHFSLTNNGFLFLGNADSLSNVRETFTPVSLKHRVFKKGQNLDIKQHLLIKPEKLNKKTVDPMTEQIRIIQAAFESSPFAQLAVNLDGSPILANQKAYTLLGLNNADLSTQVQSLDMGRFVCSRAAIALQERDRRPIIFKNVEWTTSIGTTYLDIHITPILDRNGSLIAANLTFIDVTRYKQLEDELQRSNSKLTKVSQELQDTLEVLDSTNSLLESTQKEVETLYQELQFIQT